jgi:hypothetical protein
MASLVHESTMPVGVERLFAFHADVAALEAISPSFPPVRLIERPSSLGLGARLAIRIGSGPFAVEWRAEICEWDPPHGFVDRQLEGPFVSWLHRHRFLPAGGASIVRDEVEYIAPFGIVGSLVARAVLRRMFEHRHRRTHELLAASPS